MENVLMPADRYIVYNKSVLNDSDRNILTLLYQPIIGADALNLYLTFWAALNGSLFSKEKTHHYLMATTHFDLKQVERAKEKLEAIGLLKTYLKNEEINRYVYELYSPLLPSDFFNNPILSASLQKNIGVNEYKNIVGSFDIEKIDFSDYKDISKKFKDVFEINCYSENEGNFVGKRSINVDGDNAIDIDKVLLKISEDIISHKLICKEDKEFIKRLSFVYNLTDDFLKELIISSSNQYKKIDLIKLRKKCETFFQYENNGELPGIAYKSQPKALCNVGGEVTKRQRIIHEFESTSPRDFLFIKNGNTNLTKNDREILSYLLLDLKLNPGVVNVLIDYVLRINDYKLIKKFVEVIAMQWKRAKIETVVDAMTIAEKEHNRRVKSKTVVNKKTEKVPEWFNQKINKKQPDEKKQKEIEAMLKEYE